MSSVFTFWQTVDDEAAFLRYVLKSGVVLVYPFGKRKVREDLRPISMDDYIKLEHKYECLFILRDFIEALIISDVQISPIKEFTISVQENSVIKYRPVEIDGVRLKPCNLVAYSQLLVGSGESLKLVKQPATFMKWSQAVFRYARRHADLKEVAGKTLPMTASAKHLMEEGIQLVHY